MSFKNIDFENEVVAWVCHYDDEMRNRYISDGFKKTADIIFEYTKQNKYDYPDDLIYPYLHTIRHTYELKLKMIMYNMKDFYEKYKKNVVVFDMEKYDSLKYNHSIGDIYDFISKNIYALDSRIVELKNSIDKMKDDILDFIPEKELDPYRYATDRDGNENLANLKNVSLDKANIDLNNFCDKADWILHFLYILDSEYSLGTYIKKLNREDIINIAKELPEYEKWTDPSFDTIKKSIKTKYNISSKVLSDVIKMIQNNYFLSYYISYNRRDISHDEQLVKKLIDFNCIETANNVTNLSLTSENIKLFHDDIKDSQEECLKFIEDISEDDSILLFTWYIMGLDLHRPEQYKEVLEESKTKTLYPFDDSKSYLLGKFTSPTCIENVLEGLNRSGEYELYLKIIEYLNTNYPGRINIEDYQDSIDFLKK